MMPEDIAKVVPLCERCDRARNPASPLQWFETERGLYCANCYVPPELPDTTPVPMAVIACPSCRQLSTEDCPYCIGLGVVRVPMNAIPVWTRPARTLTEDS